MEMILIFGLCVIFFLYAIVTYNKANNISESDANKTLADLIMRVSTLERELAYKATLISSLQERMKEINTQCLENEAIIDQAQDHLSRLKDQQSLFNGKIVPQQLNVTFSGKVPVDILEMSSPKQPEPRVVKLPPTKIIKKLKKQMKRLER